MIKHTTQTKTKTKVGVTRSFTFEGVAFSFRVDDNVFDSFFKDLNDGEVFFLRRAEGFDIYNAMLGIC